MGLKGLKVLDWAMLNHRWGLRAKLALPCSTILPIYVEICFDLVRMNMNPSSRCDRCCNTETWKMVRTSET